MTPERWRLVQDHLDQVLEVTPPNREAKLEALCGDDSELRRELSSLLALEADAEAFLDAPAVLSMASPEAEIGRRVGSYRLIELLGHGGMGVVFKAIRQDDFDLQVAIKLVHPTALRSETLKRFHTERQMLAHLDHPHIARLLDGGTDANGRPYLVMEYVDGEPIHDYCDHRKLSIAERLRLFSQVCEAVAFAHRNLIVHRDLKPANVLVTSEGQVKLLDFGIAKWLAADASLTRTVERPMTPSWASPEQVQSHPITTASDIYSLGLLLYHLLIGKLPCGLDTCSALEIPQRVCHHEPDRPSLAAKRSRSALPGDEAPPSAEQIASHRGCDVRTLSRAITGDLDAIVLRALRKEPEQRYSSAQAFEEDLRLFEKGFPVKARRGTFFYQAGKYLRRRRWAIAAIAALLLAAGFSISREVSRLESERRRADQVATFLKGMLEAADPDASGKNVDTDVMLDKARDELKSLDNDPILLADLADILVEVYRRHGRFEDALELSQRSVTAQRRVTRGDHPTLAKRLNNLAALHLEISDFAGAEQVLRTSLEMHNNLDGATDNAIVTSNNLATALLYQGRYDEAKALYEKSLKLRVDRHGIPSPQAASSLRSLAALELTRGNLEAAHAHGLKVLEMRRELFGNEHTATASVLALLGSIYRGLGELDRAIDSYSQALEIRRNRLGENHLLVSRSQRFLAEALIDQGELAPARILLTHSIATLAITARPNDWRHADTEGVLGHLWAAEGRFEAAEECLAAAVDKLRQVRGQQAWQTRQAEQRQQFWLTARDSRP